MSPLRRVLFAALLSVAASFSPARPVARLRSQFRATLAPERPPTTTKFPSEALVDGKRVNVHALQWKTLPEMWTSLSSLIGDKMALVDEVHAPSRSLTYRELKESMETAAGGMQSLGLGVRECVSLFSENSHRWLVVEQGVMIAGGCNAVRGAAAPVDELRYIYENSQSVAAVVETPQLLSKLYDGGRGLLNEVGQPPRFVVVLYPGEKTGDAIAGDVGASERTKVVTYDELMQANVPPQSVDVSADMPATLVYTSGTTSRPKGVVLKHRNLMCQVNENSFHDDKPLGASNPEVGDTFVSVLPCWHIFERTAEYWTLSRGVKMVYSNIRNFKKDLLQHQPQFLIAVPRLFETIYKGVHDKFREKGPVSEGIVTVFSAVARLYYGARRTMRGLVLRGRKPGFLERVGASIVAAASFPAAKLGDLLVWKKVRAGLGGKIKVMLSGGSSLSGRIEEFFSMANLKLLVGYGLTETSPVIAARTVDSNLPGTVGKPLRGTTVKIVHPETRRVVKPGEVGVVLAKGPQIMSGYQRNPSATAAAIDVNGFFDTGDLGKINPATGDILITGRAKDTIVLSNGENIEPAPIEDAVTGGVPLVEQIMLVGQDEKSLGAIVTLNAKEACSQGFLTVDEADEVQAILGPTPMSTGLQGDPQRLRELEGKVNANPSVENALLKASNAALKGKGFAVWETVQNAYLRLEPFTVENGQMTQTLKVKRNVVTDLHAADIQKMYE